MINETIAINKTNANIPPITLPTIISMLIVFELKKLALKKKEGNKSLRI